MSLHAVSEPVYYRYLYEPNDYTVPEAAVCSTIMLAIHAVSLRAHVRRACNIVQHATGPVTVLWLSSPVSYSSSMDHIVQTAWWAQSSYNPRKYSMVHKIAIPPCIPMYVVYKVPEPVLCLRLLLSLKVCCPPVQSRGPYYEFSFMSPIIIQFQGL